jgi:methanogenic corrinoid protein MtbC1
MEKAKAYASELETVDVLHMAATVTEGYFQRHPEFGEDIRRKISPQCHSDVDHHFQFLKAALIHENEHIFIQYACWLDEVFRGRGVPLEHLSLSFELIADYIESTLSHRELSISARSLLTKARTCLDGQGSKAIMSRGTNRLKLSGCDEFTQALIEGDGAKAKSVTHKMIKSGHGLIDIGVGMMQPALYEVGLQWQANRISVAQEHLAVAISQNMLARAMMVEEYAEPVGKKALFACIENNFHCFGLRIISDAVEIKGWDVDYLGADTPSSAVITHIDQRQPDMVGLSASMPGQLVAMSSLIDNIKSEFGPAKPDIVVGGQALSWFDHLPVGFGADAWFPDARSLVDSL